jgi:prepilin peptidase CpaA
VGIEARQYVPRYLIGLSAMTIAAYFMYTSWSQTFTIFFGSSFLFLICVTDTFYTKIPNLANLVLMMAAMAFHCHSAGFSGFLFALEGLLLGLALLLVPYLLGGMGAGDVKALAALGALLGPGEIFQVFLYASIVGGILALLYYVLAFTFNLRKKWAAVWMALKTFLYSKDPRCLRPALTGEQLRFPYAAAIAFGFFVHIGWGGFT